MSALSPVARAILRHPVGRVQGNGLTAAVFGSTGFLGRYVCAELGLHGNTIIAPYRGDDTEVRHIKMMGDLGNVATIPFSVRDRESVREAIRGADVVINLMGKHYETKHLLPWWINYTYDDVHVEAAKTVAEVAAEEQVPRFIHMSSIIAKPNSPSIWASSKYRGEIAVKKAFPKANIIRASIMYGPEDRFLNWFAERSKTGGVPLIVDGEARLEPVFVNDVAQGIYAIALDSSINGQTFEFVGDEEYTYKEIADYVLHSTHREPNYFNLPLTVAKWIGKAAQQFPDPKFTMDLATLMTLNQIKESKLPGLREVDIEPSKLEHEAPNYLIKYDKGGHFQQVSGYH